MDLYFKQNLKNLPLSLSVMILSAVWVGLVDSKSVTISLSVKVQSLISIFNDTDNKTF